MRPNNEDAIALSGSSDVPLASWNGTLSPADGWALVADGMGGHAAGEVASQITVELLRPVLPSLKTEADLKVALRSANDALFETMARYPSFVGMGTTIAGILFRGDHALIFNVGDSRVCLHQGGKLTQLSIDDVAGRSLLTQCLGGFDPHTRIIPHVRLVPLSPGAKLLLCSDGLTDMVSGEQIAATLDKHGTRAVDVLVSGALKAGGYDNVSAVLVEILAGS